METRSYTAEVSEEQLKRGFLKLYDNLKITTGPTEEECVTWLEISAEDVADWFAYETYCAFQSLVYRHAGPATRSNEEYLYDNRRKVLDEFSYALMPADDSEFICELLPPMPYARKDLVPGMEVLYDEKRNLRPDATDDMKRADAVISQMKDLLAIWREAGLRAGKRFITSSESFDDGMWAEIRGFGDEIGVGAMLSAYYSGVPLEDIVR